MKGVKTMSNENEALLIRIAELEAQVEKEKVNKALKFKVSDKGGLSVYGLQRWPVTLYVNQWEQIFENVPTMREFMEQNKPRLSVK